MKIVAPRLIKVAVLMGGPSQEHEVSLATGQNVLNNLDRKKYQSVSIKISKTGKWFLNGRHLGETKINVFQEEKKNKPFFRRASQDEKK